MKFVLSSVVLFSLGLMVLVGCGGPSGGADTTDVDTEGPVALAVAIDEENESIEVHRSGFQDPLLVQVVRSAFRPYLHPIVSPDGNGVLTEYSPGHHKHQTGLYWGFTRVNGRDYFHNPGETHWQKVSSKVLTGEGETVEWQTVYHMLGESGDPVLRETQNWEMEFVDGQYKLSLEWIGEALVDITIGEYDYGGLFLRMPWKEGINGRVVNAARQENAKAEGQRAMWVDVGMQVQGREDMAHIAMFDHPDNDGYPTPWRVDGELGVGPARARLGDWTIEKGATKVMQYGFLVYTEALTDLQITDAWESYSGASGMYSTASLWGIAQNEGYNAKFLTPEEAVDAMTIKEGFEVNVWASEPMMTQPMAFCWDDKGRLWIAENRDYESRGHGFANSGDSRILILEDTDHDGQADTKKVFAEGIPFPAALAVGFDGVFVGAPPHLLFIPDADQDDRADMDDIEIRLTGWGIRDRHETLNSFHWGPDGWLYGCQGFATSSKVRKPDAEARLFKHNDPFPEDLLDTEEGEDINGGVWRYHPTKDIFEVVAHGFSNPWGIDFDAKGQLFISACVIPHLWHIIPGGYYHRQGGSHFNPYLYDDIKTIVDHSHRSAHGGARIYLSDAYPEEEHGKLFMANIHEHAVLTDVLTPSGSGFVASHGDNFMEANNAQWVGFSMELGPDGNLYVLDWHDADICGKEVVNKETGRIFRITPENSLAENWPRRYEDIASLSDQELVDLQQVKSSWHARRARLQLQERAQSGTIDGMALSSLQTMVKEGDEDIRLRALWSLHVVNAADQKLLTDLLDDDDPHMRSWAVQLLCEEGTPEASILARFVTMSAEETSAVVRLYLASALQRVPDETALQMVEGLSGHEEDIDDHNLPKMIWFGLESRVVGHPEQALNIAHSSKIPILSEYIARRLADAEDFEALFAAAQKKGNNQAALVKGLRDGVLRNNMPEAPPGWEGLSTVLSGSNGDIRQMALEIGQHFGDQTAAKEFIALLKQASGKTVDKINAIKGLANQGSEELLSELPSLLDNSNLRIHAIQAAAQYDDESLGKLMLNGYDAWNASEKSAVIHTMSSRPGYGWQLAQALKSEHIAKRDIPAYVARQLRRVVGSGFVEIWGPIDEATGDLQASYAKYRDLLTDDKIAAANVQAGRHLFDRTCAPCHKMYDAGGDIGPDITGSNRQDIEYLLFNILEPTSEIQDDYLMVVITTRDGRTYSGNISGETDNQVTLKIVGQDPVVINKADIQTREVTPVSMMPAGLLSTLSDAEVLGLVKYLQTDSQVSNPEL